MAVGVETGIEQEDRGEDVEQWYRCGRAQEKLGLENDAGTVKRLNEELNYV